MLLSCVGNPGGKGKDAGFAAYLYQLFNNAEYTDIYFNLKYEDSESSFSAHKLVLALKSPYFEDKFFGEEKPVNVIPLKDIDPKYFEAMLRYMYDIIPSMKTLEDICGTYKVAKEFLVFSLVDICHQRLKKLTVVTSNVIDVLKAADYLQNMSTKNRCLNVFQQNTKEVLGENFELSEISPSMISFLLTARKVSLNSLFDLFMWIFDWARIRYKTNSTFSSPREALEEFLPQLPFASLKVEEFADLVRCHGDYFFNKKEIISIFMKYARPEGPLPHWYNKECHIERSPNKGNEN